MGVVWGGGGSASLHSPPPPAAYYRYLPLVLVVVVISVPCSTTTTTTTATHHHHHYCVVGAGPAGLQMGYFLHQAHRDYVIFERANHSGSFFSVYPRHRRLISINKRFTGRSNPEFNLRHDWNSLLSHDPELLFHHFSQDFFPEADSMVRYLNEYAGRLSLRVRYNTEVRQLRRSPPTAAAPHGHFTFKDQHARSYDCRYVVLATGLGVANTPTFAGSDLLMGYEDLPTDPHFYQAKNVLILGRGNAAFETADSIYGNTNTVHMLSRSRARLAWNTHYVGDLRAVNNNLLDTYQLKSLDGVLEASVEEMMLEQRGDKIYVKFPWDHFNPHRNIHKQSPVVESEGGAESDFDNFSLREGYDYVLRCLGFMFDYSLFHNSTMPGSWGGGGGGGGGGGSNKYPGIKHNYQAKNVPGLYFAGTNTHSLDHRKSAGGFIHGFRYTVRVLHRMLEWRHEGVRWPVSQHSTPNLLNVLVNRINQASATYQMFSVLADIIIFRDEGQSFELLEEFPIKLLARLEEVTGREGGSVVVVMMEYGPDFSGPDKDTFRADRATGDPLEAHRSNFLHPVLYYYHHLPTEAEMLHKWGKLQLPRPVRLHHMLEDFITEWMAQQSHILPLRRFLETITTRDLRHHYAHTCLLHSLTHTRPPPTCVSQGGRGVWHTQGINEHSHPASPPAENDRTATSVLPTLLRSSATSSSHLASATS